MTQRDRRIIEDDEDIDIPVIEIAAGWRAEDCSTIDECNDAFAYLTGAVAAIEQRIEEKQIAEKPIGRLKAALRYKKAALQIVNLKRSQIAEEKKRLDLQKLERVFQDVVASEVPTDQYKLWMNKAKALIRVEKAGMIKGSAE